MRRRIEDDVFAGARAHHRPDRESPRDQARGTGKIAVGGVIHKTDFQIEGISRRWDWNDGEDAIVIGPSGQGGYYDFRLADDEGRGTASSFFKCHER